ncbi:TRAP-type C4-dicarboxylate transport system, substrate-binding protein [Roseovarius marisflavi]|uniref:TRAP-type C4-dicarboxylate transport system, substrate-binding protein n=1 Tax=Roseovarius marisflavi TaxID=1054996 RepID=A0A1M7DPQ6_9RHOB|nr:TRAP transporter substrate-binding protein DctP [Roseovarius marisflavi]SHL81462.1 TRAP-type C4-dicarboxylate transport system, substrate-binding protein [Roseovarius marisflavi]
MRTFILGFFRLNACVLSILAWARAVQLVAPVSIVTAILLSGAVQAQTELRLGTAAPSASPWGVWVQDVADEVEKASDGALRIRVIGDAALGREKTLLRQSMKGRLDMIMISNVYLSLIEQEIDLVSSPFLFDTTAQGSCVAVNHLGSILEHSMEAAQLVPLGWLEVGNVIVFSRDPIAAPSDLEGKKVRISETSVDMLFSRRLGAVGVPLGISDTILSLQTGSVDAAFLPAAFGVGIGIHKIAPHLTISNHTRLIGTIAVSKLTYDRLSPQEQKWLEIVTSSGPRLSANILDTEEKMLSHLPDAGVTVRQLSEGEKSAWRTTAKGIQDEFAASLGESAVQFLARIEAAKAACDD